MVRSAEEEAILFVTSALAGREADVVSIVAAARAALFNVAKASRRDNSCALLLLLSLDGEDDIDVSVMELVAFVGVDNVKAWMVNVLTHRSNNAKTLGLVILSFFSFLLIVDVVATLLSCAD